MSLNPISNKDIIAEDLEWLTYGKILDKNRNSHSVVYNLIKPLPTTTPNGSIVDWNSSNEDVITTSGDVFRDTSINKYVTLTATITQGSEIVNKEFLIKVLKNAIETKKDVTFKKVDESNSKISIVFDEANEANVTTSLTFDANIGSKVEKIINDDSVQTIVELEDKIVEVFLNTDGTTQSQTEVLDENNNSVISSININVTQSDTTIDANGTINTSVEVDDNSTFKTTLDTKALVSHIVENSTSSKKTTQAISKLVGSKVDVSEDYIETTSQIKSGGYIIKAIVTTDKSGKTKTKFTRINLKDGSEDNIANTLDSSYSFEAGNEVQISDINNKIYIRTRTPLGDDKLIIE
jgi:hypothetical protein